MMVLIHTDLTLLKYKTNNMNHLQQPLTGTENPGGTSFHGSTITTTVKILTKILGKPDHSDNDGSDKVNFE